MIEYDPEPPFDSGSPDKADSSTMRLARRVLLGDQAMQKIAAMSLQMVGARIGRARGAVSGRSPNVGHAAERARN